MPYIARTNGGTEILEFRSGTLADLPEIERADWRVVQEVPAARRPGFSVSQDGSMVVMEWQGGSPSAAWTAFELRLYAAEARWNKTQGGLTLPNGVKIDTSDSSQAKITQALLMLQQGWVQTVEWKAVTGWVTLDEAAMTGIAQAVAAHVQACFSAERELLEAIALGAVTSRAGVDAWPWP